ISLRRFGIGDLLPRLIRIERGYLLGQFRGLRAEIFFVHHAVMIDDKGHHAGISIFGRIGHEPKAADHLAIDDVIRRAAAGGGALLGEDFKVIAVVRRAAFADPVTLPGRAADKFATRAFIAAGRSRPIQSVFFALAADDALGINTGADAMIPGGVLVLRVHISQTGLYRGNFVAADAPRQNLLAACDSVETPSVTF